MSKTECKNECLKIASYLYLPTRHLPAPQAIVGLTHPQAPASAGDVSRCFAAGEVGIVAVVGFGGSGHDRFEYLIKSYWAYRAYWAYYYRPNKPNKP